MTPRDQEGWNSIPKDLSNRNSAGAHTVRPTWVNGFVITTTRAFNFISAALMETHTYGQDSVLPNRVVTEHGCDATWSLGKKSVLSPARDRKRG